MTRETNLNPVAYAVMTGVRVYEVYEHEDTAFKVAQSLVGYTATVLPLVPTTQAEAYADARVREALEGAVQICWEMQSRPEYGKDDKDRWLAIAEQRIRALIPKE